MTGRRSSIPWGLVVSVGFFAALLLAKFIQPLVYPTGPLAFDPVAWRECDDWRGDNAPRWRMRADALKQVRIGMTSEEVESIFGSIEDFDTPTWTRNWRLRDFYESPAHSSPRYYRLVVDLDRHGRVSNFGLNNR